MPPLRYSASELLAFATGLLRRVGARDDIAATVADVLVTGDLLGHTTHGLALLAPYLGELEKGTMSATGEPQVQNARASAELWDGGRLPGPWLTMRAMDAAMAMARTTGTGTVVIRRSHHIACLAAYLLHAAEQGLVGIVQSSDPILAAVVPHGGITPIVTPNPIAVGIPTSGDPILVDVSTSITSMGFIRQRRDAGEKLPGPWVIDAEGHATDDPNVVFAEPKGALLPLGGLDAGYKGFGLALMIEALTAGLAGRGRADPPEGWGATVFVQALDPAAFGGDADFRRQMDRMVEASHASRPRPGVERVRVPGEAGMRRLREQRRLGVALYPSILPALLPWSVKLGVAPPPAVG
jgi:LDH2 family malate/lactate/ureidoglycolate dehydrogenase